MLRAVLLRMSIFYWYLFRFASVTRQEYIWLYFLWPLGIIFHLNKRGKRKPRDALAVFVGKVN